ncbi:MAG: hypothetical protein JJ992_07910, partial [Planctomycetes bacterium]|nr:hypothetical protein [Planctomycetota bacterium]
MRSARPFVSCLIIAFVACSSQADDVLLRLPPSAGHDLVLASVDLTAAARWCQLPSVDPNAIRAFSIPNQQPVDFQFVPAPGFDPVQRVTGTVILRRPAEGPFVRLAFDDKAGEPPPLEAEATVRTATVDVTHDPEKSGGLPARIQFHETGKDFENILWQDRLYDPDLGAFRLADDRSATVTRVSDGPLATVIQVAARYVKADQKSPPSKPTAVYQWFYFRGRPLVYVTATQRQEKEFNWREAHFLELHQNGDSFPRFAGSGPVQAGMFTGDQQSRRFDDWAGMFDDRNGIAIGAAGDVLVYDGKGGYGPYLHARGSLAWSGWDGQTRTTDAWLWLGSGQDPVAAAGDALDQIPSSRPLVVTVESVRSRLNDFRSRSANSPAAERWKIALADQLEAAGRWAEALQLARGELPNRCRALVAADLNLVLEMRDDGIAVLYSFPSVFAH